ncbi:MULTISPECIES: hypothetical protein [unclassified Borrelia]|uniref:hypothetical protein n=1 Tax=unclassified Borrelia TaxID=2649934 RepID=UPI001E4B9739|nr:MULTISPECIES: hypothetical protein [unclassified Borrelia]UGQ16663.1 hypothetical protein LSO06_04930 [Borrelia sp. RT5S]UGQ17720.1 hypothetical protein LSO05_04655 [Borrelia sp. RT1S]UGQ17820.1 hypothetical protein LSO05_05160 [Borrelia sp. RT1S]
MTTLGIPLGKDFGNEDSNTCDKTQVSAAINYDYNIKDGYNIRDILLEFKKYEALKRDQLIMDIECRISEFNKWVASLERDQYRFISSIRSKKFHASYHDLTYMCEYLSLYINSKFEYYNTYLFRNEIYLNRFRDRFKLMCTYLFNRSKYKARVLDMILKEKLVIECISRCIANFDSSLKRVKKSIANFMRRRNSGVWK